MSEEESKVPIQVESDGESKNLSLEKESELSSEELNELLSKEKEKSKEYELKLKHTLADFQNLEKKTNSEIQNQVNTKIDQLMIEFLQIYEDFVRAKEVFSKKNVNTEGLDSILKNMDSLFSKNGVSAIDALGEIFDPKFHEAISVIEDPTLDENTITKEIRKGYISQNRVIKPTLVEISKKQKTEQIGE